MGRHVFLSVLAFSVMALIVALLFSVQYSERPNVGFPWQVENMQDGSIRVFKIHLGQTTLDEAQTLLKSAAEITLFDPKDSDPVIEAYFNDVFIGGLKAKIIASFDLTGPQIQAIYDRGVRISTLGSGTRKITLSAQDLADIRQQPVSSLTYLPSINLEPELISKRFGEPDDKIADSAGDGQHWLYSRLGVDVVLSETSKEVVQYVRPVDFDKLKHPLQLSQ